MLHLPHGYSAGADPYFLLGCADHQVPDGFQQHLGRVHPLPEHRTVQHRLPKNPLHPQGPILGPSSQVPRLPTQLSHKLILHPHPGPQKHQHLRQHAIQHAIPKPNHDRYSFLTSRRYPSPRDGGDVHQRLLDNKGHPGDLREPAQPNDHLQPRGHPQCHRQQHHRYHLPQKRTAVFLGSHHPAAVLLYDHLLHQVQLQGQGKVNRSHVYLR